MNESCRITAIALLHRIDLTHAVTRDVALVLVTFLLAAAPLFLLCLNCNIRRTLACSAACSRSSAAVGSIREHCRHFRPKPAEFIQQDWERKLTRFCPKHVRNNQVRILSQTCWTNQPEVKLSRDEIGASGSECHFSMCSLSMSWKEQIHHVRIKVVMS